MAEGERERERVVAQGLWSQERASELPVETSTQCGGKEGNVVLLCSPKVLESPKEHRMGSPEKQSKSWAGGRPFVAGLSWALPTTRQAQRSSEAVEKKKKTLTVKCLRPF